MISREKREFVPFFLDLKARIYQENVVSVIIMRSNVFIMYLHRRTYRFNENSFKNWISQQKLIYMISLPGGLLDARSRRNRFRYAFERMKRVRFSLRRCPSLQRAASRLGSPKTRVVVYKWNFHGISILR